jgi:multisubunit Na+/H+ antiporter MnhB subunit
MNRACPLRRVPRRAVEARIELVIAVALGLAAILTAGAVYLNERQEHKATIDFHAATHDLVIASAAESNQEKAARYTLVEVILATSLLYS